MALAKVTNLLAGYPTKWGQKIAMFVDWTGPTLYATGGVALTAAELGIGGIEGIIGGVSQSGTYFAIGRISQDNAQQSCKILVFQCSDGAEAGAIDLDAEIFRLGIIGV